MRYPLYYQLPGTPNLYVVQGPSRFWDIQRMGGRVRCTDVVATTWPERQRILDMVSDEGPWERMAPAAFFEVLGDATWAPMPAPITPSTLEVQANVNLAAWTTFGVEARAQWFVSVTDVDGVRQAVAWANERALPVLILGGGSNMLLHRDVDGLVIHLAVKGVEVVSDDGTHVQVAVGAGEVWHDFVMHTLDQGWGGLENLSLIPGSVGASPMQNIGAYGVEIKDHFAWLDAVRLEDGALQRFDADACAFGYRESVFKRAEKGKWVIVQVAFNLARNAALRMGYGAIEEELSGIPNDERTARDVSNAVIRIRQSKLPDPAVLGNAGSFFKNPTVAASLAATLAASHPTMPQYPQPSGDVKLAAGWLIEQAGWKGARRDTHGVHDRQALVLVNHGGATGAEVWQLAQDIMASVKERFGVTLEPEVNQIGLDAS